MNGAQEQQADSKSNHYNPDTHNLYAVSTDKKSACDSKLIVNHSSQKTTSQQKEYVSGLVVQLQQRQSTPTNATSATNSNNANSQQEQRVFPKEEPVE